MQIGMRPSLWLRRFLHIADFRGITLKLDRFQLLFTDPYKEYMDCVRLVRSTQSWRQTEDGNLEEREPSELPRSGQIVFFCLLDSTNVCLGDGENASDVQAC